MCTPPVPDDPRSFVVAARAVVPQPEGQWQLQVQVMHWRGETWRGGQLAADVFDKAVAALRGCQLTSPLTSPSLTTDTTNRVAAVVSGVLPGQAVLHEYLLVNPLNSTVVEVAMWATTAAARRVARGGRPADPRRHELAAVHGVHRFVPVRRCGRGRR